MKKVKNKIRLYFRNKYSRDNVFSSEIFDNLNSKLIIENPHRVYHDMYDILNDSDTFTVFTDNSFTQKELHMMQDVIFAHGRHVYGDERVNSVVCKIERLLLTGCYLPENKNEIIKK